MVIVRHLGRAAAAALAFVLGTLGSPAQAAPDPVEELRQALRQEDVRDPSPEVLDFRAKNLDAKVKNLKTMSDLRRALVLDDWKVEGGGLDPRLVAIDRRMRQEVGQRLTDLMHAAAKSPEGNVRLAAANMISEMGPTVRALNDADKSGFTRTLTPIVMHLAEKDPDLAVRQEALRALGTINPDLTRDAKTNPVLATDVFQKVLLSKDSLGPRRVAASGLHQLIRVATNLRKAGRGPATVLTNEDEVMLVAQEVAQASRAGLQDPDVPIRLYCLEALQLCAGRLLDLTPKPFERKEFPSDGRELNINEKQKIIDKYEEVRRDFQRLSPLGKALSDQVALLPASLASDDVHIRLAALNALDYLGSARLKLKKLLESVPFVKDKKVPVKLIDWSDPLESFFKEGLPLTIRALSDTDVRIRRQAAVFMELLEDKAEAAIPELAKALEDPDRFVRWSATRALRAIAPDKSQVAAVALGKLLSDTDVAVRLEAAATLEAMGLHAKEAAPAVAQGLREGDPESRAALMAILNNLEPQVSQQAVPLLIENLSNQDPRVRKASCESLGKIGPLASAAVPKLRQLIGDEDAEVRQAASDALLSILGPRTK